MPSEHFSPLGQLCHVRDIEIDGYHVRLRRMLDEDRPLLVSIDGDALAIERRYNDAYASDVLAAIREARRETLDLVSRLTPEQFARTGEFDGYGALTVRGNRAATTSSTGRHAVAARQDRRDAVRALSRRRPRHRRPSIEGGSGAVVGAAGCTAALRLDRFSG